MSLAVQGHAAVGGELRAVVSVPGLAPWAEELLAGSAEVDLLVAPGQDPHHLDIPPRDLVRLSRSEILFTIGLAVEAQLVPKLREMNPDLRVVALDADMPKRKYEGCEVESPDGTDPHVWLSPRQSLRAIDRMSDALEEWLPAQAEGIAARGAALRERLEGLDQRLQDQLALFASRSVYVIHPAYGYFLDDYRLRQVALESPGHHLLPAHVQKVMEEARAQRAGTVIVRDVQEWTSGLNEAWGADVHLVVIDPLAADLPALWTKLGEALEREFKQRDRS